MLKRVNLCCNSKSMLTTVHLEVNNALKVYQQNYSLSIPQIFLTFYLQDVLENQLEKKFNSRSYNSVYILKLQFRFIRLKQVS